MSRQYGTDDFIPHEVIANRLDELAEAVTKRGEERDRELTRRIPAQLDRDADLVLAEAAKRIRAMGEEAAKERGQ